MAKSPSREEVFRTITSHLQEHKIITFKWLSRTLKLHSTLAKEYLEEWINKSPKDQYIISYTVFGRKDNGELLLMLTTDITDDYFDGKNVTVIEKHMYSIQLSDSSFEPSFIYNVDKSTYELQQMSLSSINYHAEIIQKDPVAVRASTTLNGNNERCEKNSQNNICHVSPRRKNTDLMEKGDVPQTSPQKNEHSSRNTTSRIPLKKNISQIESQAVLDNQSTNNVNKNKQSSSKKSRTNKPVVAITNFFGRKEENESKGIEAENLNRANQNSATNVEVENIDNLVSDNKSKEESKKETAVKTRERARENQESDLVRTKKTKKKVVKRMKRILKPLDSDSDEDSNDSDTSINNDEIIETEQERVEVKELPPEPRVIAVGGKKRKRKVIEEEGEEDGFMVTTKKVIYESCDSEDELEEFSIKENLAQSIKIASDQPEEKPKIELPIKKKQLSILTFFQKPKESKT